MKDSWFYVASYRVLDGGWNYYDLACFDVFGDV